MPLEDLDLEFEDEEELKKKSDALHDDVVLEFGTGIHEKPVIPQAQANATPTSSQPASTAAPVESAKVAPKPQVVPTNPDASQPNIKRLEEVRAKMAQTKGAPKSGGTNPGFSGNAAMQIQPQDSSDPNLAQLVDLIENTKFDARVEVAVAQQMSVYMAEMLSDAKLLQHQVQQLLMRLNQKSPANKPELVAIQKALADFINKKRKFPHE
jgi:hypothetical protein